jgi:hypothetical protein
MNYLEYALVIANQIPVDKSSTAFQAFLPSTIDYAEQRIYRELNLLSTRIRNSSSNCTANNRSFTLPTNLGTFITVTEISIITPVGSTAANGTRNVLMSAAKKLVDVVAPTNTAVSASQVPSMYYMLDQQTAIFGPSPGAAFNVEVTGTIRPAPLSATNTTTFLTTNLPDLFVAASMVYAGNNMRDFGIEAGNASIAQSWEQQYQALFASANAEETRKRYNLEVSQ